MPYFDIDEAMRYASDRIEADSTLDLGKLPAAEALATLEAALEERRAAGGSMIVRFQPAAPGSGETLFQPVGRWLLAQKRAGRLRRVSNLLELGAGFYIEF
ncbi:hypothetical protein QVG61_02730 [Thiohalobacter sp. IOR34]|uniref:hypothetical protein n=1 Tax=Thiohalobacter sp. IOR34 TaxID=3057176 RepID=UPI0025B17D1E|nr:hypothetical protein [Thiohalobacter sp. IOR34]WJW76024.1 hypothetical protein QVG61_02730 [Thiohalobacter sp. IOR34]